MRIVRAKPQEADANGASCLYYYTILKAPGFDAAAPNHAHARYTEKRQRRMPNKKQHQKTVAISVKLCESVSVGKV
jgi:hypothetical protein